jgi:hypothetical protein
VSRGHRLALLTPADVLDARSACRVEVHLEDVRCVGLGLRLDGGTALLVLNAPPLNRPVAPGAELHFTARVLDGAVDADRVQARLARLVGSDAAAAIGDRAARHALLYILEARGTPLRLERLALLKRALAAQRTLAEEPGAGGAARC